MRLTTLVAVSLTTLRVLDTLKESLPVIPPPAAKSVACMGIAAGMSVLVPGNWQEKILLAGGAAGLASLLHDMQTLTRLASDSYIAGISVQARRTTPLGSS